MGRLFDEEKLEKYIIHDGCEKGCGYIDERDLKCIPTVEAIPKDQYKADMVAMLEVIKLRIDNLPEPLNRDRVNYCVQEKINNLKGNENGNE